MAPVRLIYHTQEPIDLPLGNFLLLWWRASTQHPAKPDQLLNVIQARTSSGHR